MNDDQSDAVASLAGDSQPGRQRIPPTRRGDEASRTSPGSGLGLAFVAAVAASHGGTAHAQNTGQGAAVTVKIPC
ncbi:ATP-binding protein [Streptomyces sp. NPDC055955]|uniref:ATP-binding protein n=1 Tax=Streptomyces sp. NPDC055955 TaxID=3345665 RepID=UPI0035E1064D